MCHVSHQGPGRLEAGLEDVCIAELEEQRRGLRKRVACPMAARRLGEVCSVFRPGTGGKC